MSDWKETTLGEIADVNPTERLAKETLAPKVTMDALQSFTKKISGFSYEKYKGGTKFRNGDTLVARITPCLENGKTAYVDILKDDELAFGSTEFIVLREKENESDKRFLYYFSTSPDFRDVAILAMTGSSGRQRVQINAVTSHLFKFPPLPEQKAIAGVLASLDDKIDLLHRQNKTLESTAETLFRQYFIEQAQDDWEEVKIKDFDAIVTDYVANGSFASLAENVTYNDTPDYAALIRLTDYNNGFSGDFVYVNENAYNFLHKSKLSAGDVIISNVGAYSGTVFRCPNLNLPMTLGPNSIVIKSNFNYFFYTFFKSPYGKYLLDGIISGSAQPKFNKTAFRNISLNYPSIEYLEKFEKVVSPHFEKIDYNQTQIKTLENLRDTLLPKLISGDVRVEFENN